MRLASLERDLLNPIESLELLEFLALAQVKIPHESHGLSIEQRLPQRNEALAEADALAEAEPPEADAPAEAAGNSRPPQLQPGRRTQRLAQMGAPQHSDQNH